MLLWWHWVLIWTWTGGGFSLGGYFVWKGFQPPKYPRVAKILEEHAVLKEYYSGAEYLEVKGHFKAEDVIWLNAQLAGLDEKVKLGFKFDPVRIRYDLDWAHSKKRFELEVKRRAEREKYADEWKFRQSIAQTTRA